MINKEMIEDLNSWIKWLKKQIKQNNKTTLNKYETLELINIFEEIQKK